MERPARLSGQGNTRVLKRPGTRITKAKVKSLAAEKSRRKNITTNVEKLAPRKIRKQRHKQKRVV